MIEIPFNVNNTILRKVLLGEILPQAIRTLNENDRPLWGKMNAQQMVEHLIWTIEIAMGKINVECTTPERLLPRVKNFLHNNIETPHEFKNPLIGDNPLPDRYANFFQAKAILLDEIKMFVEYLNLNPETENTHPIFGRLGHEEWEKAIYKHCIHHLSQFGLISINQTEIGM